jgi:hypothetical protein
MSLFAAYIGAFDSIEECRRWMVETYGISFVERSGIHADLYFTYDDYGIISLSITPNVSFAFEDDVEWIRYPSFAPNAPLVEMSCETFDHPIFNDLMRQTNRFNPVEKFVMMHGPEIIFESQEPFSAEIMDELSRTARTFESSSR